MFTLTSAEQEEYIVPTSIAEVKREVDEINKNEHPCKVDCSFAVAKDIYEDKTNIAHIDESSMRFTYDSETDTSSENEEGLKTWKSLIEEYRTIYGSATVNAAQSIQCLEANCKRKVFKDYVTYLNHMRFTHYDELKLCCDVCSRHFPDRKQLANHRFLHTAEAVDRPAVHMCSECGRSYANSMELGSHFKLTHFYKCSFCKKPFVGKLARDEHMYSGCAKAGKIINLLDPPSKIESNHDYNNISTNQAAQSMCVLIETEKRGKLVCRTHGYTENCRGLKTLKNVNIKKPKRTINEPKPKKLKLLPQNAPTRLQCFEESQEIASPICDNVKATHSKERPLVSKLKKKLIHCPKCPTTWEDDAEIQQHLMIHMDTKIYPCKMCSQEFSNFYALKQHMDSHKQEYPFACPKCYQRFRMRTIWMFHMERHKKPMICALCSKGFKKTSSLTGHMMVCHL